MKGGGVERARRGHLDVRRRLDVQFLECLAKTSDWIEVNERPIQDVQATDRPCVKKLEIT